MRHVVPVGVALAMAISLTGCLGHNAPLPAPTVAVPTSTPSPTPSPLGTPAEHESGTVNAAWAVEEYEKSAEKYADDLPDGYVFPTDYPGTFSTDWMLKGTGEITALTYWRCAWTDQLLTDIDDKDSAAVDHDLDTLDTWDDFEALQYMYTADNRDQWSNEVMAPAREGHISLLRTLGRNGCTPVREGDEG